VPVVGLPPAFVPPVVAVPAANSIVPFIAPAAASAAVAVGTVATAPLWLQLAVGAVAVGVTAAALASIWGTLNQGAVTPSGYIEPSEAEGTVGWVDKPRAVTGNFSLIWSSPDVTPQQRTITAPPTVQRITVNRAYFVDRPWPGGTGWSYVALGFNAEGGQMWSETFKVSEPVGYALFDGPGPWVIRLAGIQYFFTPVGEPAEELEPQTAPSRPGRVLEPSAVPEPAKAPPVVVPIPYSPPAPAGDPLTEPAVEPSRQPRPVVAPPVTVPLPTGQPLPGGARGTTPSGQVEPAPQPPPRVTPPTVHVINGTEIPGNGPQATPQGIAQELGRLENKLGQLLSPQKAPVGDLTDRLGLLFNVAMAIKEYLEAQQMDGAYQISSPCVVDANGDRVVYESEYAGAGTYLQVLSNKVDALAGLLQLHKDLKQPICRQTPATGGQPVTVNFVQID
jgi:hypothetical protein